MTTTAAELLAKGSPLAKPAQKSASDLADYTWATGTPNGLAYAFSAGIQILNADSVWNTTGDNVIEFDFSNTNDAITIMGGYWPFASYKDDYGDPASIWKLEKKGDLWHATCTLAPVWGTPIPASAVGTKITGSTSGFASKVFGIGTMSEDSKVLPVPFAAKNFQINKKFSKQEFGNVPVSLDNGATSPSVPAGKKNIADAVVEGIAFSYDETGSAIEPTPIVYYGRSETPIVFETNDAPYTGPAGTLLQEGKDYTVDYANNIDVSTPGHYAQVNITGIGDYAGSQIKTFVIVEVGKAVTEDIMTADPDYVQPTTASSTATTKVTTATTKATSDTSDTDEPTDTNTDDTTDETTGTTRTTRTTATTTTGDTGEDTTDDTSDDTTDDTTGTTRSTRSSATSRTTATTTATTTTGRGTTTTTRATTATAKPTGKALYGDLDYDNTIDILDVVILQLFIVEGDKISYTRYENWNIVNYTKVGSTPSISDLIALKQFLAGWDKSDVLGYGDDYLATI
jgi:hypothetical protein